MRMSLRNTSNSKKFKLNLFTKRNLLIFIISLFIIGIIVGIILFISMTKSDQLIIKDNIDLLFKNEINNNGYLKNTINSLYNNLTYVLSSFILGISIIGVLIILFILFFKGVILGVSATSIFAKYQIGGFLGNLLYLFPDKLLSIFLFIYMSYFAILFGINLFMFLFLKKDIDLQTHFKNYLKKLYIGLILATIISILEVFISPIVLNIFTFFIK